MALSFEPSKEQREAQGRILARKFGLPNADDISSEWSVNAFAGKALLSVTLVAVITLQEAADLINGREEATP